MSRYHYWSYLVNQDGEPINAAEIYVYLAGGSTAADVFATEASMDVINSYPGSGTLITTDTNGFFGIWIGDEWEDSYGYDNSQKFKIAWVGSGAATGEVDDVVIFPMIPLDLTANHGLLTGLEDDDHPQYTLDTTFNDHVTSAGAHGTDHGLLSGLEDDDHPQYTLDTTFNDHVTSAGAHVTGRFSQIDKSEDTVALTIDECSDTLITNRGWDGIDDQTFTLPDADTVAGAGLKFKFLGVVAPSGSADTYFDTEGSTTKVYLNGVAGADGDRIWIEEIALGDSIMFYTVTLDGTTYDWFADTIMGAWLDKGS